MEKHKKIQTGSGEEMMDLRKKIPKGLLRDETRFKSIIRINDES